MKNYFHTMFFIETNRENQDLNHTIIYFKHLQFFISFYFCVTTWIMCFLEKIIWIIVVYVAHGFNQCFDIIQFFRLRVSRFKSYPHLFQALFYLCNCLNYSVFFFFKGDHGVLFEYELLLQVLCVVQISLFLKMLSSNRL